MNIYKFSISLIPYSFSRFICPFISSIILFFVTKNHHQSLKKKKKKCRKPLIFWCGSEVMLDVSEVANTSHVKWVNFRPHWNNFPLVRDLATLSHHHYPDNFPLFSLPSSCFHFTPPFFLWLWHWGGFGQTAKTQGGLPATGLKWVFM